MAIPHMTLWVRWAKNTTLHQDTYRNNYVGSGSEDVENVKSLKHTDGWWTDEPQTLSDQKSLGELKIPQKHIFTHHTNKQKTSLLTFLVQASYYETYMIHGYNPQNKSQWLLCYKFRRINPLEQNLNINNCVYKQTTTADIYQYNKYNWPSNCKNIYLIIKHPSYNQ